MRKRRQQFAAKRRISGGPEIAMQRKFYENQLEDLANLRRELEEQNQQLRMSALQTMGQMGQARSQAESRKQMLDFQARLQQYQDLQNAIAELMGVSGTIGYENYINRPTTGQSYTPGLTMQHVPKHRPIRSY